MQDDFDQFDRRRKNDPQGLIDDLVGQTTRQAKAIHDLTAEKELLSEKLAECQQALDGDICLLKDLF